MVAHGVLRAPAVQARLRQDLEAQHCQRHTVRRASRLRLDECLHKTGTRPCRSMRLCTPNGVGTKREGELKCTPLGDQPDTRHAHTGHDVMRSASKHLVRISGCHSRRAENLIIMYCDD